MKKLTDKIIETAANVVEDNNKIFDSLETERMTLVREIAGEVIQYMNNFVADRKLNEEEKNMLVQTIIDDLNNEFEENGHLSEDDDENQHIESGYSTENLTDQGIRLGKILTAVEELIAGEIYAIVDLGMNEWNGGYLWKGKEDGRFVFEDQLSGPTTPTPIVYTDEEMSDMIENGQIALEA
mgnify:CR=1 FL=1